MAVPLNILRWLPVIIVTGTLCAVASVPGSALPSFLHGGMDKVAHAFVYGLLAASFLYGFGPLAAKFPFRISLAISCICLLYALVEEWYQQFIPGRVTDCFDIRADAIGFLVVISLWFIIKKMRNKTE